MLKFKTGLNIVLGELLPRWGQLVAISGKFKGCDGKLVMLNTKYRVEYLYPDGSILLRPVGKLKE